MLLQQLVRSPIDIMLHDHLDGSRPLLNRLHFWHSQAHGSYHSYPLDVSSPTRHLQAVIKWFGNPFEGNIVEKFSLTTGLMQTDSILADAALSYVEHRAKEGFKYCEATVAPQYHTFKGLTEQQVMESLIFGIKQGELIHPEIEVNLIFAVGREVSSDRALQLVRAFDQCDPEYVVAMGLVCDEKKYPPDRHFSMFKRLKEMGRKKTCHAGEFWDMYHNVITALMVLEVDRLDHATPLARCPSLMYEVALRGIGVTGCPCSYPITGAISVIEDLEIPKLIRNGVLYSIHVDDDLFMPTMAEVVATVDTVFDHCLLHEEKNTFFETLRLNAWKTKFGSRKYDNEGNRIKK